MTPRPTAATGRWPAMSKLLGVALVIVTLLPIVIFATDLTNRPATRAARQAAVGNARVQPKEEASEVRRERVRLRRAEIHPTAATILMSLTIQFVILAALGAVGKKLFALRL